MTLKALPETPPGQRSPRNSQWRGWTNWLQSVASRRVLAAVARWALPCLTGAWPDGPGSPFLEEQR